MAITELTPQQYLRVRHLLQPLDYNLSIACLLAGESPGRVFVDQPEHPTTVLVENKYHLFLAGSPHNPVFNQELHQLIRGTLLPQAAEAGRDSFLVDLAGPEWEPALEVVLAGKYPMPRQREYYACTRLSADWRDYLLPGFELLPVSAELAQQTQLQNRTELLEEMTSERPTVEDFFARSFGVYLRKGEEITGWCLSEYNTGARCEVGVATGEAYRRQGLGTAMALALVERALGSGYQEVGWHCWQRNAASGALARKAGFEHRRDYTIYLCVFALGEQLAVHGYEAGLNGQAQQALAWYDQAIAEADAPAWAFYESARWLTKTGRDEAAIARMRQAREHGFQGLVEAVRTDPDFTALRQRPDWEGLL